MKNSSPKYTNRLFLQSSPYLLQHAHNPVNWYPWGDEAFYDAKRLDRPVLLKRGIFYMPLVPCYGRGIF